MLILEEWPAAEAREQRCAEATMVDRVRGGDREVLAHLRLQRR